MKTKTLSLDQPARYRIRLQAHLKVDWTDWMPDAQVTCQGQQTTLTGTLPDQSALFGLLSFIRDLNIPLLLVEYIP
jgi:hypothetical protein